MEDTQNTKREVIRSLEEGKRAGKKMSDELMAEKFQVS